MRFDESLRRVLDYSSRWVAAELICGLLQHDRLYEALADGLPDAAIAELTGLPDRQAGSLMTALAVEDVVARVDEGYRLTDFGRSLTSTRGWMDLFMRGYGGYFRNAGRMWHGTVDPAWRDIRQVGLASVQISEHGALPAVSALIRKLGRDECTVVDVGCANGHYLARLCEQNPMLRGIGVEPSAELCAEADQLVAARGLTGRVSIVNAGMQDYRPEQPPDFVIFAFVLQELTEQIGVEATTELLADLGRRFASAYILVVEVDLAARDRIADMRDDPYLRGYYNAYYLLHDLTEQRLLRLPQWHDVFAAAGLLVEHEEPIDRSVDPTGLEVVFALRPRQ